MKYPFSEIIIIYNPNSTGNSEQNARALRDDVLKTLPTVTVQVKETKHAGHAEEIAAAYVKSGEPVLLVSSSGDGGYNELVNGVQSSPHSKVTVCVLPSGNANDHDAATSQKSLVTRIVAAKTTKIDLIKLEATKDGKPFTRYAHSYIGFGLTAYISKKLTEASLNPVNEKWLVVKYFLRFRYVTLRIAPNKSWQRYSSVVIANINRMSKVIKLDSSTSVNDGKIELYVTRSRSSIGLAGVLLLASSRGLMSSRRSKSFTVIPRRSVEVQLDGEVTAIDAGKPVRIFVAPNVLKMLA